MSSSSCHCLFSEGQRLLSDAQRLFNEASSANMYTRSAINGGTSISQVMGDIGTPRELSGFPATNILETPETYELQSEVPGVDKDSIKIEVPDSHTLTILGRVQEDDGSTHKEDKMEEDPVFSVAAGTQTEPGQPKPEQGPSMANDDDAKANEPPSVSPPSPTPPKAVEKSEKPRWWTNERVLGSFGSFRRSFFFLDPIMVEVARATIKSGVVKIVLQKAKYVKSDIKLIQLDD